MYNRPISFPRSESFFLFGPRGTGKTFLLKQHFAGQKVLFLDLLNPKLANQLIVDPNEMLALIEGQKGSNKWVVIDEVQKVPALLDLVHQLIEDRGLKFALSGSSARKLRRGSANLLAGRAVVRNLYPLTSFELGKDFNLISHLQWGGLPRILAAETVSDKVDLLDAYVTTYLQEEIISEQIVRALPPFRKFLSVAAQANGQIVNFSKLAQQIGTQTSSVIRYFQILEDTLIGGFLEPYETSIRKRIKQSPKFYMFDTGVVRSLQEQHTLPLSPQTYEFGRLFETFVINELVAFSSYYQHKSKFFYLRTKDDAEIDLIIAKPGQPLTLVEIKSSPKISRNDCTMLGKFASDLKGRALLISNDKSRKTYDNVTCIPWTLMHEEIW